MGSAQTYDDGNLDVPGGCEAPVERVIVIGAGIAGLTAGNALANAGVECIVLEARDRIGGRLHTVDVGGVPIDLGGSWIHTPIGNPLRRLADQLGVACVDGSALDEVVGYDRVEQRRLSDQELGSVLAGAFEAFPGAVEGLKSALGPDAAAAEAVGRFIAEAGLGEADARRTRGMIRASIAADAAELPERVSLRWLGNEDEYEGDFLGDVPVGGYRRLIEEIARGLTIRLGKVVTTVDVADTGVRVVTADGGLEEGSHVVCTVPLGVLKAGVVTFTPQLPADRLGSIERLGFGHFEKVVLRFDEPFWRAAGVPHMLVFPADEDDIVPFIIGQDAYGAGPALVCLVLADNSHRVLGGDPKNAVRWVLEMVGEAVGSTCPEPTAVATTSWGNDPFARGSYTSYPPGAGPDDVEALGRPLFGRLLFAGESTQTSRLGYADGSMQSGIREAKRLLQRSSVTLRPLA